MKNLKNPIALAALAAARRAPVSRRVANTRTADKFVLRINSALNHALVEIAKSNSRSANSEIIIGLTTALEEPEKALLVRDLFASHLGADLAGQVLAEVQYIDLSAHSDLHKSVIRLPDGLRGSIADTARLARGRGDVAVSMNRWSLDSLVWWVNLQRETHALLNACAELPPEGYSALYAVAEPPTFQAAG